MGSTRRTSRFCVHPFDVTSQPAPAKLFSSLKDAVLFLRKRDVGHTSFRRVTDRLWASGGHGNYAFAHPAGEPCPEAWR